MSIEFIFAIAVFILFVTVLSLSFFFVLFEIFWRRDTYERSYTVFMVITLAILLHTIHHLGELYLESEFLITGINILAFLTFAAGATLAGKILYGFKITLGVQEVLQAELDKRTAELKRSIELKEGITDILGHDLLNYITVMKNIGMFLGEDESLKNAIGEDIRVLNETSAKMERMVRNVTKLAKLESPSAMEKEALYLGSVIEDVIKLLKAQADEKGITIVNNVRAPCPARANRLIEDVFANLLSNAIKYGPKNSKVTIDKAEDDSHYTFAVKDNGEGVPDEYKSTIFSRFARRARTGVKGTGLGLTIVKKTIELHGGAVWVEDNPEGGSIFYAKIPKGE